MDKEDIEININNNYSFSTQVPPSREGFILTSLLLKDSPTVEDEVVFLLYIRRQLRKAIENKEVSS